MAKYNYQGSANRPVAGGSSYSHLVNMDKLAKKNNQKEFKVTVKSVEYIAPFLN